MNRHNKYCCNQDCAQGRNCPARVAKIGRKYHGFEPLGGSVWRRQLRYLASATLVMLAVILVSAITVGLITK